jgi:hypothetical protein
VKQFLIVIYGPLAEDEAERSAGMAAMAAWYKSLGASLLDPGAPFVAVRSVSDAAIEPGPIGPNVSGYNLVQADSIAAAAELAKGCPLLKFGLRIAVYETFRPDANVMA